MIDNTIIIGGGLLGTEIQNQIKINDGSAHILKGITNENSELIPKDTDCVIIVAQSKDYKEKNMTKDLFFSNTILPLKIILEAHKVGVKKIGFCSTGSIYVDNTNYHLENEPLPSFANSPYASTKRAAELILETHKNLFERLVIYRPFFIYGKNQTNEKIIPRMIDSIRNKQEINLAQNKGMIFNPINVEDAARFVIKSLETKNGFDVFNVAGNEEITLKSVVDIVGRMLDINPKLKILDGNPAYVLGDIKKMKSIGFIHKINLEDGLKSMLN